MAKSDNYLLIPDLQIPFHHPKALEHCKAVAKEYNVPPENVYNMGDEVDEYFGSQWKKSPDTNYSATQEIKDSKDEIRRWGAVFPKMKLCVSNHGIRWARKFCDAEIPSQLMIPYKDLIGAPSGWVWRDEWVVNCKYRFRCIHGMGYSGVNGARNAANDAAMSTAIGHLHAFAGINFIKTQGSEKMIWSFNVGAIIDDTAYAFEYSKYSRNKSINGVGIILSGGKTPLFIPL